MTYFFDVKDKLSAAHGFFSYEQCVAIHRDLDAQFGPGRIDRHGRETEETMWAGRTTWISMRTEGPVVECILSLGSTAK